MEYKFKKHRMCVICGDTSHMNVRNIFRRESDDKCYYVCAACREKGFNCETDFKYAHRKMAQPA